jgi:glycerol kinase
VWSVPAFQGLGTPHMDPGARAVLGGLSRGSTRAHVVRAVLEGIVYRSREVLETLFADSDTPWPERLRVDGGAATNDFLLQHLANVLGLAVERPYSVQASALGAAYLAGLATGVWRSLDDVRHAWRSGAIFEPQWNADQRDTSFRSWQTAVAAARARVF